MNRVRLLDGPRNGDFVTSDEAYALGYVYDEPTSAAWAAVGEDYDVMVHEDVAREYEAARAEA
jgi:hypothetical protein